MKSAFGTFVFVPGTLLNTAATLCAAAYFGSAVFWLHASAGAALLVTLACAMPAFVLAWLLLRAGCALDARLRPAP